MKNIKEKWHNGEIRHPCRACVVVYVFLFLVALGGYFISAKLNLFPIEANNARYMLSALAQSQATIIAIVISLSLVAVQLTASAYSPRVNKIFRAFRTNPSMWVLVVLYVFAIPWDLFVLIHLETKPVEGNQYIVSQDIIWSSIPISFEHLVSVTFWLGAVTFLALIPYMLSITALLDPSNIIKRLAGDANRGIKTQKLDKEDHDPIQPLIGVIHGAAEKHHLDTAREGFKKLNEIITVAIETKETTEEWKRKFFGDYLPGDLQHVCKLFADTKDEKTIVDAIINFAKNYEDKSDTKRLYIVKVLKAFEESAKNNGLKEAAKKATQSLTDINQG